MALQDSIQRASRSLVFLSIERGAQGGGIGTAFVVGASGDMVTAAHLVREATRVEARVLGSGKSAPCAVVATDLAADVALIRAEGVRDLAPMPLWRGEPVAVGKEIACMGFPHADILPSPLVMTMRGIVGNRYRLGEAEHYVLDVNASEGMSGGPVFLAATGEAIGVIGGRFDPGKTRARLRGHSPEHVRDLPSERSSITFAPAIEYVVALLKKR
jgi:S1-C subfamily serine protease